MPTAATVAVSTVAKELVTVTLPDNTTATYDIPYSNMYRNAVVQVLTGNAGDTYTLEASANAVVYATVGETVTGTVPTPSLTGNGMIWYTKDTPLHLRISYVTGVGVDTTIAIRLEGSIFQGSRTRSL